MSRIKFLPLLIIIPILFAFMIFGPETAASGGVFTDSGQLLGNNPSYDVALGDLDGDGDLDAFVANYGLAGNANKVWLNDGSGLYTDSGQSLGASDSYHVALGDVDNDGDLDAFIGNSGPNRVWLNQGGLQGGTLGDFSDSGQTLGAGASWGVALGDIDADGDLDAVTANAGFNEADKIWFNQGGVQGGTLGGFVESAQNLGLRASGGIALGDLDGDTDLDVFITHFGGAPNGDRVWFNDGSGSFTDSGQLLGTNGSSGVSLADLDGDGDLDAFVGFTTFGANTVWMNQGGVQAGTPGFFQDNGQTNLGGKVLEVGLGDVDDDGDVDAFLPHYLNGVGNTVWLNNGVGLFADSGQSLGASNSYGLAMGDVDGDLDLDVFIANYGNGVIGQPNKVWLNGAGAPTPTATATATPTATPTAPPTPAPPGAKGWQKQLVDTRGDRGRQSSIALDSHGYPHIVYVNHMSYEEFRPYIIQYARWDGLDWQISMISRVDELESEATIALALDSQDEPHIVYEAEETDNQSRLWYVHLEGIELQKEVVADNTTVYADIAVDSADRPHIVYSKNGLQYTYWDGTDWQNEEVGSSASVNHVSLVLDENDYPHMSYRKNGNLSYGYKDSAGWHLEVVDNSDASFGWNTSLALDNANRPHIAYIGGASGTSLKRLSYASWTGSAWQIEILIDNQINFLFDEAVSLGLDANQDPHIVYSKENGSVYHQYWDGTAWQIDDLDNRELSSQSASLVLDAEGDAHISYYDDNYHDLIYLAWEKYWQTRPVPSAGQTMAPSLDTGSPQSVGYYDLVDGRLYIAKWEGSQWVSNPAAFIANPPIYSSHQQNGASYGVSYYDSAGQRLMFTQWNGFTWNLMVVDDINDVGRYNALFGFNANDNQAYIAYWDATVHRVKFAEIDNGNVTRHVNTAGPPLNADSGYLSAGWLKDLDPVISYYDGVSGDLRVAIWEQETESWTDELVDGATADVGYYSSLYVDKYTLQPTIAYYDATNQAIKYAYRSESGWHIETAVANVGDVQGLSLKLEYGSLESARISYVSQADDSIYVAMKEENGWRLEGVVTDSGIDDTSLNFLSRLSLGYGRLTNGLGFAFRTVNPGIVPGGSPGSPPPPYDALTICFNATMLWLFGDDDDYGTPFGSTEGLNLQGPTTVTEAEPLTDGQILEGMTPIFAATQAGEDYIRLYVKHAPEMGQIGLDDPGLLFDSYGTLQNFLPGLEAFVTGQGHTAVVSQEMVDDALDIWSRIAAQANLELAGVINSKLAQYNNLQDFVGMTFDEWALALGVNPPPKQVFLPVMVD